MLDEEFDTLARMEVLSRQRRAPDLFGYHWLNGEPVSIRENRGSIILLEFWDYTDAGSIHGLRYVDEWFKRYADFGLIVVGVHSPRYSFGQKVDHVQRAVDNLKIEFPIVMDNDASIWDAFRIRRYPSHLLIDRDGFVRYFHEGDGGYEQFERAIQALLNETGQRGLMPDFVSPFDEIDLDSSLRFRQSSEIDLGYIRGSIGNHDGYNPNSIVDYSDPGIYLPNRFYLNGKWLHEREYVQFRGEMGEDGYIMFQYEASGVHAVMHLSGGREGRVDVNQDGSSLSPNIAGEDVQIDQNGESFIRVHGPRLYHLVQNKNFGGHVLQVKTSNPDIEFYSFSFQTSIIPELFHRN